MLYCSAAGGEMGGDGVVIGGLFEVGGVFFFSSRRRHTISDRDWSSDVCSSDLAGRLAKVNSAPRFE